MDHNKETQSAQESQKKSNSRRTILKRASAGVVLTSLPAQSVWGAVCTLSGAQSGNMSGIERHKDCEKPDLSGGRSPGSWKALADAVMESPDKLRSIFVNSPQKENGTYSEHADLIRSCYLEKIKIVAEYNNMVRDAVLHELTTDDFQNNLYLALGIVGKPGGLDYNLAAVWLNVYYGLYDVSYPTEDADVASSIVEQMLAWLQIQNNVEFGQNFVDADYGFTSGTTTFTYTDCDIIPAPVAPVEPCITSGNSGNCKKTK
jgi:hypothetical protein